MAFVFITELTLKPRFYNIGPTDYTYQDTPKVDGLVSVGFTKVLFYGVFVWLLFGNLCGCC